MTAASATTPANPPAELVDAIADLADALAFDSALRSDYRAHQATLTGAHDQLRAAAAERIGVAAARVGALLGDDHRMSPVFHQLSDRLWVRPAAGPGRDRRPRPGRR